MAAGTRSTELAPTPQRALVVLAQGAAFVVALGAALRGLGLVIGNPMTVSMLGAVGVSLVAGRGGIRSEAATPAARRRALWAGAVAASAALLGAVAALALGASLHLVQPSLTFVFGAAEAAAVAYRDEVWLHGLPLAFALRARVPTPAAATFAVLASLATTALLPGNQPEGLLLTATSSALFVALWLRTKDPWAPVAAHFAWIWVSEALLSGELLDVVSPSSRLARGGAASGAFAWVAAAAFVLALLALRRGFPRLDEATFDEEAEPSRAKRPAKAKPRKRRPEKRRTKSDQENG